MMRCFGVFLAAVDPENDITLVRDTDSRFTKCELLMVNEWLASGKKFHVMHWDLYDPPIMAGLWGVRGGIPDLRESLESTLRSAANIIKNSDQIFLRKNLYPQMKGKVFVHEQDSQLKRRYFVGETIHPFPPIAKDKRGKYLNIDYLPVGMRMPLPRLFFVFSIYKRTIFSEVLLTLWLGVMEKKPPFRQKNIRFYVADNINPSLIERLRRLGRVILKSAKTVRKDDPQYWKLLVLSDKSLGLAVIVDFWQFFFLVLRSQGGKSIYLYGLRLIEYGRPLGFRGKFARIPTLSVCGPDSPIFDIETLITRRDPNENYREFIRSNGISADIYSEDDDYVNGDPQKRRISKWFDQTIIPNTAI